MVLLLKYKMLVRLSLVGFRVSFVEFEMIGNFIFYGTWFYEMGLKGYV